MSWGVVRFVQSIQGQRRGRVALAGDARGAGIEGGSQVRRPTDPLHPECGRLRDRHDSTHDVAAGVLLESFENGLAARLPVAMPESRVKRWTDHEISDRTMAGIFDLFDKLFELRPDAGTTGDEPAC